MSIFFDIFHTFLIWKLKKFQFCIWIETMRLSTVSTSVIHLRWEFSCQEMSLCSAHTVKCGTVGIPRAIIKCIYATVKKKWISKRWRKNAEEGLSSNSIIHFIIVRLESKHSKQAALAHRKHKVDLHRKLSHEHKFTFGKQ